MWLLKGVAVGTVRERNAIFDKISFFVCPIFLLLPQERPGTLLSPRVTCGVSSALWMAAVMPVEGLRWSQVMQETTLAAPKPSQVVVMKVTEERMGWKRKRKRWMAVEVEKKGKEGREMEEQVEEKVEEKMTARRSQPKRWMKRKGR